MQFRESKVEESIRSPDFCPALRTDLKFFRAATPSVVVVNDPVSGRRIELYEIECMLAQEMDGTKTIEELTKRAQLYLQSVTRPQLEKLIIQFAALGLLGNLSADPFVHLVKPEPVEGTGIDYITFREQLLAELGGQGATPPVVLLVPPEGPRAIPESATAVPAPEPAPPLPTDEWSAPPELPWRQRHRGLIRLAALLAVLVALWGTPYPLYVTDECTIRPTRRAEVRGEIEGILSSILVDEGDHVRVGQVIAQLDDRDVEAALKEARTNVDQMRANLHKLRGGSRKEEIARAQATVSARSRDLKYAQSEANRKVALFKQGLASEEQRDNAQRDLALKRSAVEQARAELQLVRAGFRSEEVSAAEAELNRSEIHVAFLEKKLALLTIRAPIDGQIMTPKFRERLHVRIAAGDPICEVADSRKMWAEIQVPQREIDVVKLDQPVVVKVQSYPLHPFRGRVVFIGSAVQENGEKQYVRVDTEIDNTDGLLHEHMSGYAEIDAGRKRMLWLLSRRLVRWVRVRFLI